MTDEELKQAKRYERVYSADELARMLVVSEREHGSLREENRRLVALVRTMISEHPIASDAGEDDD